MSYKYNSKNKAGTTYTKWTSNRGSSNQKLQPLPPVTNTANGVRYYSSIDAEIYFGDIFIGDVTNITWMIQQQTLPLYGYNSYTFDDMAIGSRIIQGQFAINFTERNYLINKVQNNSGFQKISRRMYGEDNPVTCDIYSDFRQRLHLPMWDKGFDIVIGFGEGVTDMSNLSGTYSTFLVLNCVQLTGSQIQLDFNGDPIGEVYSFTARDIKEAISDATAADPSSVNSETLDVSTDTGSNLNLTGIIDLTKSSAQVIVSSTNNITFTAGTYQITDTLSNSSLKAINGFTVEDKKLIKSLSNSELSSYKTEFASKDSVKVVVKSQYTVNSSSANKGESASDQRTINFTIKK
jgi:hypothetical protein